LQTTAVDLSAIANEIADELHRDHPERVVTFRIAANLQVWGDAGLLRAALSNLLQNAWKFTGKTHNPVVEVGAHQQGDRTVYFVRDNGAGFDMAYASRLFGAFQRLHAERDFPGTGIGLATVRRVMRRHGGDVWAESEVGKGATFYFTLDDPPAAGAAVVEHDVSISTFSENDLAVDDTAPVLPGKSVEPTTVLLVDDDESMLMLLEDEFKRDGHTLFKASSAEEGLQVLAQHDIRVVVSDYSMPGMSGADFLKQVASRYPHTVRIILSGQASNREVEEGIGSGEIYRHINKQRDFAYLRACIRDGMGSV
jgi:CheY-like chemotaxis protein